MKIPNSIHLSQPIIDVVSSLKESRVSKVMFLTLTGFILSCVWANKTQSQDFPPTLVVVDSVMSLTFHDQVTLIGRTKARSSSRIVSAVSGVIASIEATEGLPIARGEPLALVASDRISLLHMAKKAEAAQAKAQADLALNNLRRAEELFNEKAIAENRMDEERSAATAAFERYNQLSAEEKRLKIDLNNCVITAPYDGYTVRKLVDVGEWVSAGDPVFEIVDLAEIKITVDLPEKLFGKLSIGSSAKIIIAGKEKPTVSGVVTGIAPSASDVSHTFPVYITVDNSSGSLAGGMLVRVTLNMDQIFTSLAVSKDAIVNNGPSETIYTIVEGKAAPISVQSSSAQGDIIAISGEGLSLGMIVVVRGNERIFPGSPLRTAGDPPPASPTPSADDSSAKQSGADSTKAMNQEDSSANSSSE